MKKKTLVIVESPTKIKTLKKFLSDDYVIESSVGHIRDLPKKGFGIDIENDFTPVYEPLPEKKEVIAKLKKSAKQCGKVLLAPDPDREGEAIAWHIQALLPEGTPTQRISFNAITKDAVLEAIDNPRDIDEALVDAQQARRLLDRVVGYKISPILQRRIKTGTGTGLSAGRVQSIALKLVVDREKEIDAFNPVEYWVIDTELKKQDDPTIFSAYLYSVDGLRVEKEPIEGKETIQISNEVEAASIKTKLKNTAFTVSSVVKRQKKRNPVPPFITSTLQQEASRHHGFAASRTMGIAQSLYEGVDMGKMGSEGLITYMRTDSIRSAPESITAARKCIKSTYGEEFLPEKGNYYKSKKNTQDAHEAIRPTRLDFTPEKVRSFLTTDQFKLYSLIYKRFLSSQMKPAVYDTVTCDIATDNGLLLRTTGSVILFKGFLAVYEEKTDDDGNKAQTSQIGAKLPALEEGQILNLHKVDATQTFTKPPPRFTEASLVKELEKQGIGRPSTYASIMSKILSRAYTEKERLTMKPTELGKIIAQMLESHFSIIMNIAFTANMETDLDEIAENKREWKAFLKSFWEQFFPIIEKAEKEAFVPKIATDIDCPKCGKKLQKIWAKNKYFYGCSGYPDCSFTVPIEALEFKREDYAEKFDWDQNCPKCSADMKIRFGRFGAFLGCTRYPECNGIVNIPKKGEKLPEEMPQCPAIGCDGRLTQRTSRWGKPFFSCSNYPDCDVIGNSIELVMNKYPNHPKTPYVKKAKKGAKKTVKKGAKKTAKKAVKKKKAAPRNMPKYKVSSALGKVIGEEPIERAAATKKLWDYIKAHNLQDEKNKRSIVPDALLADVFGSKEAVDMMKLAGILSKHLEK